MRIIDLAHRVLELTGSKSELRFVPHDEVYELGVEDVLHREPSIEKIGAAIGWAPTRSLDDILADVIAYERAASAPPSSVQLGKSNTAARAGAVIDGQRLWSASSATASAIARRRSIVRSCRRTGRGRTCRARRSGA